MRFASTSPSKCDCVPGCTFDRVINHRDISSDDSDADQPNSDSEAFFAESQTGQGQVGEGMQAVLSKSDEEAALQKMYAHSPFHLYITLIIAADWATSRVNPGMR